MKQEQINKIKELELLVKESMKTVNNLSREINEIYATCLHPIEEIVEGKYIPENDFGTIHAPFRVCKSCGLAEEGWGCGYQILAKYIFDIPEIERKEAQKFVRSKVFRN